MLNKDNENDRVRKNTSNKANLEIDKSIIDNITKYSTSTEQIASRIEVLDKEWSIERALELNMSIISLLGLGLTIFIDFYWILLPIVVLLFFIQHALQGWCPPLPLFRYFKVRTRAEIDKEKYALKVLRGDFDKPFQNSESVFNAVIL